MFDPRIFSEVKMLAEGSSNQCRAANRLLLAVLTVSFFILVVGQKPGQPNELQPQAILDIRLLDEWSLQVWQLSHESSVQANPQIALPFFGVEVPRPRFLWSSLVLLSVLMIAFTVAQMQVHLSLRYVHRYIDTQPDRETYKEMFDRMFVGVFGRVASIDQVLQEEKVLKNQYWLFVSYLVLKFMYWIAAIILPVWALFQCCLGIAPAQGYLWVLAAVATLLFVLPLFVLLLFLESRWVRERFRRMCKPEDCDEPPFSLYCSSSLSSDGFASAFTGCAGRRITMNRIAHPKKTVQ